MPNPTPNPTPNPIIIIPSRLKATRLPNKPLLKIHGKELILRVYEQALKTGIKNIIVACGNIEIKSLIEKNGGTAILTKETHPSGTDRIHEALIKYDTKQEFTHIINLQGDLPNIDKKTILTCYQTLLDSNTDIATVGTKITDTKDKLNPNIVKAVIAENSVTKIKKALYFTRGNSPFNPNNPQDTSNIYHHIGIYAYTKSSLTKFVSLKESNLEKHEKLEQLRAIENDLTISFAEVNEIPLSIDTQEDLILAENYYQNQK
jgi:3-deoxy-manno-octulosonate cytidylyltransferase (CMP-KDO synthetase)